MQWPSTGIAVPITRKQRLRQYLDSEKIAAIGAAEWDALLGALAPISEGALRRLLHGTGLPFEQPFAGVRQQSFEALAGSLVEMEAIYAEAVRAGDRERARYCRRVVIQAKDHAKLAARNPRTAPEKREQKQEMVRWMLVWLENPGIFPLWVKLRTKELGSC